jgi:hypothetical protein
MAKSWKIKVLTPDFLIDGSIDSEPVSEGNWSDTSILEAASSGSQPCTACATLTTAKIQAASNIQLPDNPGMDWVVIGATGFLAVIPNDEATTTYLVKQNKNNCLLLADVYVGPYVFHGKVWSPNKIESGLSFLRYASRFVMQDVTIDCLLPGAILQGYGAAYAVVRTHLLQTATIRG